MVRSHDCAVAAMSTTAMSRQAKTSQHGPAGSGTGRNRCRSGCRWITWPSYPSGVSVARRAAIVRQPGKAVWGNAAGGQTDEGALEKHDEIAAARIEARVDDVVEDRPEGEAQIDVHLVVETGPQVALAQQHLFV